MNGGLTMPSPPISKQFALCLLDTNEFIKHKFWECVEGKHEWGWSFHIMCELNVATVSNFDWKQASLMKAFKFVFFQMAWHLASPPTRCFMVNLDMVFNCETLDATKANYILWDKLWTNWSCLVSWHEFMLSSTSRLVVFEGDTP